MDRLEHAVPFVDDRCHSVSVMEESVSRVCEKCSVTPPYFCVSRRCDDFRIVSFAYLTAYYCMLTH